MLATGAAVGVRALASRKDDAWYWWRKGVLALVRLVTHPDFSVMKSDILAMSAKTSSAQTDSS